MITLLLLATLLQQEVKVSRTEKAVYLDAVRECDRAVELIPNSPAEAIQVFTRIIENRKIADEKKECWIQIERRPGDYGRKYDFFPWRFRGLARIRLAEKTKKQTDALAIYRDAEKDLQESVRRGIPSSQDDLDGARKEAERLEKETLETPKNSEIDFRNTWQEFLDSNRFASAWNYVTTEGGFISPKSRQEYLDKTDQSCLIYIGKTTSRFLSDLERLGLRKEPFQNLANTLERDLLLPPRDELTDTIPAYHWCNGFRKTLERSEKEGRMRLTDLLDQAIMAISLSEKDRENPWLLAAGKLVYVQIQKEIRHSIQKARNAPQKTRTRLREEASLLEAEWGRLEKQVRDKGGKLPFTEATGENLARLMSQFPADYDGFARLDADLETSIRSADPDQGLAGVERSLDQLRNRWEGLSLESRCKILRYMILTRALRRFFIGRSVEETAQELTSLGTELRDLGGSFVLTRFGPKVAQVFEKLR